MHKKKIWFGALTLVFAMLLGTVSTNALTSSEIKEKIAESQKKSSEAKEKLQEIEEEKITIVEAKEEIDNEIAAATENIEQLDAIIEQSEENIQAKQVELDEANQKLEEKDDSFKTRLRFMYEQGTTSYLDVLFGAESFSDFISRLTIVQDILAHDKELVNEVAQSKQTIEDAKNTMVAEMENQEEARDLAVEERKILQSRISEQEDLLDELNSNQEKYEDDIKKAEAEEAAMNQQLLELAAQEEAKERQNPSSAPTTRGSGIMMWPLPAGGTVTCEYGYRTDPYPSNHKGIDIALSTGNSIVAVDSGTVTVATRSSSYGNYVMINHGNGLFTLYAHASQLYVSAGDAVTKGQTIAAVGSTGWSTGPHLHFEVIKNGANVNPRSYIG